MKSRPRLGDQYRQTSLLTVLIVQCRALRFQVKYNALPFQRKHSAFPLLAIRLRLKILSKHSPRRWLRHLLKLRKRLLHILFRVLDKFL
jgi:hypothetical protein